MSPSAVAYIVAPLAVGAAGWAVTLGLVGYSRWTQPRKSVVPTPDADQEDAPTSEATSTQNTAGTLSNTPERFNWPSDELSTDFAAGPVAAYLKELGKIKKLQLELQAIDHELSEPDHLTNKDRYVLLVRRNDILYQLTKQK